MNDEVKTEGVGLAIEGDGLAIDFDSDAPLVCPMDKQDGEPCEACQ